MYSWSNFARRVSRGIGRSCGKVSITRMLAYCCDVCGYRWLPDKRSAGAPRRCASKLCQSIRWNRGKLNRECKECGKQLIGEQRLWCSRVCAHRAECRNRTNAYRILKRKPVKLKVKSELPWESGSGHHALCSCAECLQAVTTDYERRVAEDSGPWRNGTMRPRTDGYRKGE